MNNFSLYTVELQSDDLELLTAAEQFSPIAEIDYFDKASGIVRLRFISSAESAQILVICDDFKKEFESGGGTRLIYKVERTVF